MQFSEADAREVTDLLEHLAEAVAQQCSIPQNRFRHFANSERQGAANGVGYTIQGCTAIVGWSGLHARPADALQLCEDGTFWMGLAVLPDRAHTDFPACMGVCFQVLRGTDGRFGIHPVVGTSSQGDIPADIQSRMGEIVEFVRYFRPVSL